MAAYYNEIDPYAAEWLRELMKLGLIADGIVDERSIEDVRPIELKSFRQCHFFAGIGLWSYALKMCGVPDDYNVWTGSCPCQPFSTAGQGKGFADERHLWPSLHWLISQRKPTVVFGEQVASKAVDSWIDLVHSDMEGLGYAFGCVPFPAAGVGAPQIRDRCFWVADSKLPHAARQRKIRFSLEPKHFASRSNDADNWAFDEIVRCSDRKSRPIKSSIQPLAYGDTMRLGRLRAYGGAICPKAAAAFISSFMGV